LDPANIVEIRLAEDRHRDAPVITCALVTGAQGFVGRYLVAELLASYPDLRIVGVGRSQPCGTFTHPITWQGARIVAPLPLDIRFDFSNARYQYLPADIRDRAALLPILSEFRPDLIFHLASGLRDDPPHHLFGTSAEGSINFLESIHEAALNPRSIVIGSSGSVYGLSLHLPITEESPCEPRDFYAVSKLAQEHVSRILARERQLPVIVARIFNIVGPGQDERHVAGRFGAQIAAIAAGASKPRLHIGELSTTRDFIDVRDVARALVVLARRGVPGSIYNVASGIEMPVLEILEGLIRAANLHDILKTETTYSRASDIPRVVADITRLRAAGYNAAVTLQRSLSDVLDYYGQTVPSMTTG
jgi:nucleoside-diphosphate-sugar epimerase